MSSQELQDPSEAVPAATAGALDARREAERDAPPLVVRELTVAELGVLVGSLSVSARKALGVADALRRERGADAVHMEHLLVGTYVEQGGHQWQLFSDAGLGVTPVVQRLTTFELRLVAVPDARGATIQAPTADAVAQMPPLSAHATLALSAAATLAAWTPGQTPTLGLVQARHLLGGWLAVGECSVVAAFAPERPGLASGIAARIDSDRAGGTLPDGVAADQRRRLDALLGDPPRVVWERLAPPAPATPRTGTGGGAANDRAEGDDRLGFNHYVQAFANLVDSPDTRPPLTIGIFGAWGSGKSFLLRHLTDEIERRGAEIRLSPARTFGAWLRRRIRGEHTPPGRAFVYCVSFNAWEYNASEHIWPRLVRRVLDSVTRDARWHRRPLRWAEAVGRKLQRNFARKLRGNWQQLVAIALVGATLWWTFRYLRPDYAQALAQRVLGVDTSDDKFSVPAIVGGILASVELLRKVLFAPLGGWVTALLDDGPGYGGESDFVRAVRADLDLVDRQLVAEGSRVLILIDDLDRCEPDKAVEVLQAINLLLDRRSFVVCLGIDARVITAAVEKHYEELLGPAGITGYEYLDKIIQIPFRIPDPTSDELALFVSKQLGDPTPDHAGHATIAMSPVPTALGGQAAGVDPATATAVGAFVQRVGPLVDAASPGTRLVLDQAAEAASELVRPPAAAPVALSFTHDELLAFKEIAPFLRPNPRHVKRLVNVYALVRSLAELGRNRTILEDPAATVRWLTLCAQWPYAVRAMLLHLDAYGPPATGADDVPPLRWLHDAVRPALDPARCARYDHDGTVLQKLVASSDGLSWSELAVLRAYTVNFNPALDAELRADVGTRTGRRAEMGDGAVTHFDRRRQPPA